MKLPISLLCFMFVLFVILWLLSPAAGLTVFLFLLGYIVGTLFFIW